MITIINDAPANVAAFRATGEVLKEDFEEVVLPHVDAVVKLYGELNYVLVLDTDVSNFTMGAWMQDALLGLKNMTRWNRAAIVTDKESIKTFTGIFSKVMPGEFRGFDKDDMDMAIQWASTGK
ncbi:MAG: STAS/SEC14 domain-containing protein [Chitinophagaceae bacterium]|nr:MAG: STAS/SEC14 domain-containing protein [Chitinophagaceae bacterium]